MANVVIDIDGIDEALRLLGKDMRPAMQAITHGVGELVRDEMATYPGPVSKPIEWASEKQRRWYFASRNWLVKKYGIPFQYERLQDHSSERLRDRWTTDPFGIHNAVVTNSSTYAYWVQSATGQQPFHRNTGWITDEEAVLNVEASGDIDDVVNGVLRRWLGD